MADQNKDQMPETGAEENGDRRARKREQTRERIFVAAIELVAERGLANVTVEQITERADVGKGTFFNYFANKEAVLKHFGAVQVERLKEAHESGQIPGTPRERLEQMLCLLGEHPLLTPELARGLFISALSMTPVPDYHGTSIWGMQEVLAEVIREGQAAGQISRAHTPESAALFMLGQHFLALLTWCTGFTDRPLVDTIRHYVVTCLDGLAS